MIVGWIPSYVTLLLLYGIIFFFLRLGKHLVVLLNITFFIFLGVSTSSCSFIGLELICWSSPFFDNPTHARFWDNGDAGGVSLWQSSLWQLLLSIFHQIIIKNYIFKIVCNPTRFWILWGAMITSYTSSIVILMVNSYGINLNQHRDLTK